MHLNCVTDFAETVFELTNLGTGFKYSVSQLCDGGLRGATHSKNLLLYLHNREYVSQVSIILTNATDKSAYKEGKFVS